MTRKSPDYFMSGTIKTADLFRTVSDISTRYRQNPGHVADTILAYGEMQKKRNNPNMQLAAVRPIRKRRLSHRRITAPTMT